MAKRKTVISEEFDDTSSNSSPNTLNDILIDELKSEIGGSAYVLGEDDTPADVTEWLSTGSTILDMVISNNPTGNGGIPVGRLTEIHGDPSTGKSLLAYMILKDCAAKGGISVLIDTENAANIEFLNMLGLDPRKNLTYVQVDTVEDVFATIETVIRSVRKNDRKKLVTIVWDSIAGTSTRKEMEEEVGNQQVAMVPRLLGQGCRKVSRLIGDQRIALVFLNQLRAKIGVVFGDPMTTPGGNAVPFFADVRVRLRTAGKIKAGAKDIIGVSSKAQIIKNRFGPPYREAILNIYFDKGLIDEDSWFDFLKAKKLIKKLTVQKSQLTLDGETFEFKNKEFMKLMRSQTEEFRNKIKQMIKDDLYIEQDPDKREDEITIEEVPEEELLGT